MTEQEFLRYCLDDKVPLPAGAKEMDWSAMLEYAKRQTIIGVVFQGIERAGKEISMPFDVLMKWVGYANQIKNRNKLLNQRCVELVEELKQEGFQCCVLKGQGNALMYPNPYTRSSGDIDVWVIPNEQFEFNVQSVSKNGYAIYGSSLSRERIIEYARNHFKEVASKYHHISGKTIGEVDVELHFFPGFVFHPLYNYRLKSLFNKKKNYQFSNFKKLPDSQIEIPVPTKEFNIVYQLSHLFKHYICGGIGLRQMIDYYYLLRNTKDDERCKKENVRETLKYLNLYKFAGAVMYIMKEVLGLDENYLIVPVDEKRGKKMLNAIMEDGNFGHYSKSFKKRNESSNHLKRFFLLSQHTFGHFSEYPIETITESIYRIVIYFKEKKDNR